MRVKIRGQDKILEGIEILWEDDTAYLIGYPEGRSEWLEKWKIESMSEG